MSLQLNGDYRSNPCANGHQTVPMPNYLIPLNHPIHLLMKVPFTGPKPATINKFP